MNFGKKWTVYGALIGKGIIFGSAVLFTGDILNKGDLLDVLSLRFLISTIFLLILRKAEIITVHYTGKTLKPLFIAAVLEPVLYYFVEAIGIGNSTATISGSILALTPIATILLECILLRYRLDLLSAVMVIVGVSGIALISLLSGDSGSNSVIGILFLLMAVVCDGIYLIYLKKSTYDFTAVEITYFTAIFGAAVFSTCNVIRRISSGTINGYFTLLSEPKGVIDLLFLGVFSTIIGMLLVNYAASKVKPSILSALGSVSTLVTIFLGIVVNHDKLYYYHLIGIPLICIGSIGVGFTAKIESDSPSE